MEQEKENRPAGNPFNEDGMFAGANPILFELAKELRKNMTHAETLLWNYLKSGIRGYKFRRQHPISIYIADFYCHPLKLIIELDGKIHDKEDVKKYDEERELNLKAWGYQVIRFKNDEIVQEPGKALMIIQAIVEKDQNKLLNQIK